MMTNNMNNMQSI